MNGMMAGMGIWGLLVLLTVVAVGVLAVLGGVWFYRQLRDRQVGVAGVDTDAARDTLRARYAAGEIDDEERRLSALTHWR